MSGKDLENNPMDIKWGLQFQKDIKFLFMEQCKYMQKLSFSTCFQPLISTQSAV